ncbi:hypothetical protein [Streptomyces sp. NPDC003710]
MKRSVLAVCAASVTLVVLAAPAAEAAVSKSKPAGWSCPFDDWCTKNTRSGPGGAAAYRWFTGDFGDTLIRQGNSKWGLAHIKQGGSYHNKQNHPYDSYAVSLWDKALSNVAKGAYGHRYPGSSTFTWHFGRGKKKRTMCVITDDRHLNYNHVDYGLWGIRTAYWVKGHVGWKGCGGSD